MRAPGAALLRLEVQFTRGLDRVQVLMGRVLLPIAPHVAWDLAPLAHGDPIDEINSREFTAIGVKVARLAAHGKRSCRRMEKL